MQLYPHPSPKLMLLGPSANPKSYSLCTLIKRTPGVARPDGMYHSELLWDYGAGYWERWEAAKNAEVEAAEAGSVVGDGEEAGTPVDSPSSEIIVQSDELHVHVHESLEHVHSTPSHSSP